jgi:AcrR family transcriptional regulator
MRDTRASTIHAHLLTALKHSGIDQDDFAEDVARLYFERTPLHARSIEFHQHTRGGDPYAVRRANAQLLFRMLKPAGPVRMPVEIEEAVVLALPQPYRDECLRELNERYGLLAAALPAGNDASLADQVRSPCDLMRKAAAAVERIAPMLEDGRIGPEDAAYFADALAAINAMMGCGVTLTAQIANAMREARDEAAR